MYNTPQRSSLVVRARYGKRLPQFQGETVADDSDLDSQNLPGPVTLTVTEIRQPPELSTGILSVTPTVPVSVPPPSTTSSTSSTESTSISSSLIQEITPTSGTTSISRTTAPTPSASANNGSSSDKTAQSNALMSKGVPAGAIVGIVVAVALFLIAAIVFLARTRSIRNRLRLRGRWANRSGADDGPSFLWIEPKEKYSANPFPFPYPGTPSQSRDGEVSQGASRPSTQILPYIPPPAPPRPPPAYGTEAPHDSAHVYSPKSTIPATFTQGRKPTPAPVLASSSSPSSSSGLPVFATVRSTFIPTLPDELSITAGEVIQVMVEYDDGWALCFSSRGEKGMVPLECLDRGMISLAQQEGQEYRKLSRANSLTASSRFPMGRN